MKPISALIADRPVSLARNDKAKQLAILIRATDEAPAEEMLILQPMSSAEYLAILARSADEVLTEYLDQLEQIHFAECVACCDLRLYNELPIVGRHLRADWHKVGNEATGPTPDAVAKSSMALDMGRPATPGDLVAYRGRFPLPAPMPFQRELVL